MGFNLSDITALKKLCATKAGSSLGYAKDEDGNVGEVLVKEDCVAIHFEYPDGRVRDTEYYTNGETSTSWSHAQYKNDDVVPPAIPSQKDTEPLERYDISIDFSNTDELEKLCAQYSGYDMFLGTTGDGYPMRVSVYDDYALVIVSYPNGRVCETEYYTNGDSSVLWSRETA